MRGAWGIVLAGLLAALTWAGTEDPVLQAMELPAQADALRDAGVPDEDVRAILAAARDQGVPADDAAEILGAVRRAVDEGADVREVGARVVASLTEGESGDLEQVLAAKGSPRQGAP